MKQEIDKSLESNYPRGSNEQGLEPCDRTNGNGRMGLLIPCFQCQF